MLEITALCGIDQADTGLLASSMVLRDSRCATIWVDPSTAFLGRMSALISDGVGWQDSLEIDAQDCLTCSYLNALRVCIERVVRLGRHDLLALRLAPSVEADAVLESLCATLDPEHARLDTVVGVLKAGAWLDDLSGGDILGERGIGVQAEDDRPVATIIAAQVSSCDLLVLTEGSCSEDELAALSALAPGTPLLLGADLLALPMLTLARTGRHQPRCLGAFERDGLLDWSADVPRAGSSLQVVRWKSERPLHAARLSDALEALADRVIRSAGRIVIASTSDRWTRWDSAGESLSLGDLGPRDGDTAISRLTFLGRELDVHSIRGLLDSCVLTDEEYNAGPSAWHDYEDPFAVDISESDIDETEGN
ncbi:GTP-binding protein [Cumulibacter soli]|uniref:GTP-binding protein n=1 Tax=Cumulibacter soli TaxID=2546344 RepID=UPI00106776E0|nr:GTP-binding protein [Cumulibacter soli]